MKSILTKQQSKFIFNVNKYWKVKEKLHDFKNPIGVSGLDEDEVPYVSLNKDLDEKVSDIIKVHEYGHIYYEHIFVTWRDYEARLQEIFQKVHPNVGRLSPVGMHKVMNICMDIQINSTLLTLSQNRYMTKQGMELCTAENYNVEARLDYTEYFEDVIKQMKIQKPEGQQGQCDISTGELPDVFIDTPSESKGTSDQFNDLKGYDKDDPLNDPFKKSEDSEDSDNCDNISDEDLEDLTNFRDSGFFGYGSKHEIPGYITYDEVDIDKALVDIVNELSDRTKGRVQDHVKLYNRRSRGNGPELYNSTKSFVRNERAKLAIIVDVSGSMKRTVVQKVLKTIRENSNLFHRNSKVVLWDTSKCDEFNITEIKDNIRLGGGTELSSAVKYCSENLGSNKILLITDFGTNPNSLESQIRSCEAIVYGVGYNIGYERNWIETQTVMKKCFILE